MKSKLFKNIFFNYLYQIFILFIPLVTTPYVSRVFGADGVGVYSYTTSLITIFVTISVLGMAAYGVREIAFYRNDKKKISNLFWEIQIFKTISVGVFTIAWIVFCFLYKPYAPYMFAVTPLLLASIFDISWFFMGLEKFNYPVLVNISLKCLSTIMIFLFVRNSSDLVLYIVIVACSSLFANVAMWFFLRKNLIKPTISIKSFSYHIKQSFVYFLPSLSLLIYSVFDKTLIGLITRDATQNGYYEQAHKIVNMLLALCCGALNGVLNSRFSFLYGGGVSKEEIKEKVILGLNISIVFSVGSMFGLVAVAKTFVPVFFGASFLGALPLFYVFASLPFICSFSNSLSSNYYTPSGRRKESGIYYLIGSLINLIFNLVFIPFLGAFGAAISTIIAEIFISVILIARSKGVITFKDALRFTYKKIIAGAAMLVVVFLAASVSKGSSLRLLIGEIISGVVVYLCFLILFKDNSIKSFIDLIQRKNNLSAPKKNKEDIKIDARKV